MPSDSTPPTAGPPTGSQDAPTLYCYVDGEFVESESGARRAVTDPATGATIATVPEGTREDVQRAVDAANAAQRDLTELTVFERADLCHEVAEAIDARRDTLAEWLSHDQGKPVEPDAHTEIDICVSEFHRAAEDVKRLEAAVHPSEHREKRVVTRREPHGVYGVVTPWNFPLSIPAEYLAPGLAVGNAVVWVPAPTTSAVAVQLAAALAETSLPDGAVNLVTGPGPVVGDEAVSNDGVDAVGFTGSPETGEQVASAAGAKPTLLELGGNGPTIVFEDADISRAARRTAAGCYGNAGQNCAASERVFVHEAVVDEFVDELVARTRETVLGDPRDPETTMGPLNNEGVAEKMDRHVADAVEKGATALVEGGRRSDAPTDLYYESTVLTGVTSEMAVYREESFGPIAPVSTFSTTEEAIRMANEIDLGLSAGVFSGDLERLYTVAERLETGVVNGNETSAYWEHHTPFGGYSGKQSGTGRLGGRYALDEMTQVKTLNLDLRGGE